MSDDRVFLDTNILVYAYDETAGEKHAIAKGICANLWEKETAVVSTQVLQEFFVTTTQKIPQPLSVSLAQTIVRDLLTWHVVVNDGPAVLGAIAVHSEYGYSFWDSLIIQAAIKGEAKILFSEDLSHNQDIEGLLISNPFITP